MNNSDPNGHFKSKGSPKTLIITEELIWGKRALSQIDTWPTEPKSFCPFILKQSARASIKCYLFENTHVITSEMKLNRFFATDKQHLSFFPLLLSRGLYAITQFHGSSVHLTKPCSHCLFLMAPKQHLIFSRFFYKCTVIKFPVLPIYGHAEGNNSNNKVCT